MGENIYVWDRFVRIFHWSLVVLFVFSYLTGEEETIWHIYSGYAITILVLSRIVWGFIGTRYARFAEFVYHPSAVVAYGKDWVAGKPRHYLGHNPLGGVMVVAMLLTLLVATVSGLKLYAVEEGKGPLAVDGNMVMINQATADDDRHERHEGESDEEELWEEIHEIAVNLMLLLILLHIGGVIISSRVHHEALVKAMISGYKNRQE